MSAERIDGIIKSCRDIMRRDKGMNTDAQRIPQLLWMLFLKCFDDFELQKEVLEDHKPIIEEPYRWRDWTADEKGRRGDELIEFVNNDLFKYLSNIHGEGTGDQRDVVADVFQEQKNFMTDGYGMKDMIQQINKLDFTSSEQFHLIGSIYEKMLLAMRDDSPGTFGEFYTPRPVIKFMVKMINPSSKARETILDPACGTGGFLIESFNHLEKQVKGTKDNEFLQKKCLTGIEPRPDPYLFSMMNMMLHGLEEPNIIRANTLEIKLSDIQEDLQSDIIMTNPPFGGEEQASIKKKLPAGFQTKDTALGFLLHCISRLKDGGRCAIILPHGPLNATGIASKIKQKLLDECNLHTIVRLPRTIFAPYVNIATNILFFEKGSPTNEIWYYQMFVRKGISAYTKTKLISFEDFSEIIKWWKDRKENYNAWKIKIEEIKNYDLDIENPNIVAIENNLTPHELIKNIIKDEKDRLVFLADIEKIINSKIPKKTSSTKSKRKLKKASLGELTLESKNGLTGRPSEDNSGIKRLGIETVTKPIDGVVDVSQCKYFKASKADIERYSVKKNDLYVCRQNGNKHFTGKFAVCKDDIKPLIYSDSLIRFRVDIKRILPEYVAFFMNSSLARKQIDPLCKTTAGNFSINSTNLKTVIIEYPEIEEQKRIIENKKLNLIHMKNLHKMIDGYRDSKMEQYQKYKNLQNSILNEIFL